MIYLSVIGTAITIVTLIFFAAYVINYIKATRIEHADIIEKQNKIKREWDAEIAKISGTWNEFNTGKLRDDAK